VANTNKKMPSLSSDDQRNLKTWVAENADTVPSYVKNALAQHDLLLEALAGKAQQMRCTVLQLRRALGITASSEKRGSSGSPIGATMNPGDSKPKNPEERAHLKLERILGLEAKHRLMAKKYRRALKNLTDDKTKAEDIELTAEEVDQSKKESAQFVENLSLGGGPDDSFESPDQSFMQGSHALMEENTVAANVSPELLEGKEVLSRIIEPRTRYGLSIVVTKTTVDVEKVVVKDEGSSTKIISASTRDIGPPGMSVTWEFLAQMAIMASQYALPFHRLGSLLTISGKRFTAAMLSRMFCYVAQLLLPIYLQLFRSLANSPLLSGDDTQTRVLEFARYQKRQKDDTAEAPWAAYTTATKANETFKTQASPSLGVQTAMELGFEWDRKDGHGQKTALQTSLLWGRSEAKDPRSTVVFYRSHIGSFGNLVSMCLAGRSSEFKNVLIQSDLASVNLVTDAELKARFDITMAGCASHARRPFALYKAEDPQHCQQMLDLFTGLYIYEKALDLTGRNEANVLAVRRADWSFPDKVEPFFMRLVPILSSSQIG